MMLIKAGKTVQRSLATTLVKLRRHEIMCPNTTEGKDKHKNKDPQKKHRLGTVINTISGGLKLVSVILSIWVIRGSTDKAVVLGLNHFRGHHNGPFHVVYQELCLCPFPYGV